MTLMLKVIDYCFGVVCKHCKRKVLDPEKKSKQIYLIDRCPVCRKYGTDAIEEKKDEEKDAL